MLESHFEILFSLKQSFCGSEYMINAINLISQSTDMLYRMGKAEKYIDNNLYDTIVTLLMLSENDLTAFSSDPIPYIRSLFDLGPVKFRPRN